MTIQSLVTGLLLVIALCLWAESATAQPPVNPPVRKTATQKTTKPKGDESTAVHLQPIQVTGKSGYATRANYRVHKAGLGPLGSRPIKDIPMSITVLPEQLLVNQQIKTVNGALRNLPSVVIRDQQGLEVSRPQSRGFVGTIDQNTRIDGLNVIGTTAIPAENLSRIEVLNGLAGSLYGPEAPAGVFNYVLKRPTSKPMIRLIESYNSHSIFTEQIDAGGPIGSSHDLGYRVNALHGKGEGYVDGSRVDRTLASGAFDYRPGAHTVIETNFSHYDTDVTGLPGSVVYFGKSGSTRLPPARDPAHPGFGQPGAGTDLESNMALAKVKHDFGHGWALQAGALYENAIRNLWGITNTFTDDLGNYTVTKNFNAIPRYTILSNLAYLNGQFEWLGTENDFSIGTNGFTDHRYSYRNSIAVTLGSANIAHPVIFPPLATPANGGRYPSGSLKEQSLILGDTMHFNKEWAAQAVLNSSWLHTASFDKNGTVKRSDSTDGTISPTLSVIYTSDSALTAYATWARSVEPGASAPAGTKNAHTFLAPYHDTEAEAGVKYAVSNRLLLTADVFRMTRPLAQPDAETNVFRVVGTQRNRGVELFAQGGITPSLSILGGITYLDPRVHGSRVPGGNGKLVVGVPKLKSDISLDWHPLWLRGLAFIGSLHFESRRAATNTNNSFAPAFATFDVGIRYSTPLFGHALTVRAQVTNLADRYYYSAIADGNIVGSPGSNTAYYGAPRRFALSVELDL